MNRIPFIGIFLLLPFCISCSREIHAEIKTPPTSGQLGLNLAGVTYYSSEIVFVDVFKQSQPWTSQAEGRPYGQGGKLEIDEKGIVQRLAEGQFAESLLFADLNNHYPSGEYTCFYDGSGEIAFVHAAKITQQAPGQLKVQVDSAKGPIGVRILKTDPKNPIRNIRLILPGFEKTYQEKPFHPTFLKRLQGYQVVRYMDWGRTNGSKVIAWKDRTLPDAMTQGNEPGVAIEYQIQLANTLEADPWFCIPHLANDEYVREFAKLVKSKLNPSRKCYVEYSNETWNGAFEQAKFCQQKGKALALSKNDFEAQLRYSSQRSVEIFKIVEEVFGSKDRLVRVLAAQAVNPWSGTTTLDWKDAYKSADAIAIAPYFGNDYGNPQKADDVASMNVDDLLDGCRKMIDKNKEFIKKYAEEASERGLQLMAYEGGQHLVGYFGAENNEKLTKLFHAANRHPKMKDLYLRDLNNWKESGGGLFCIFSSTGGYSKWGSWGLLEYHDQDEKTAPKYQAVQEWLRKG